MSDFSSHRVNTGGYVDALFTWVAKICFEQILSVVVLGWNAHYLALRCTMQCMVSLVIVFVIWSSFGVLGLRHKNFVLLINTIVWGRLISHVLHNWWNVIIVHDSAGNKRGMLKVLCECNHEDTFALRPLAKPFMCSICCYHCLVQTYVTLSWMPSWTTEPACGDRILLTTGILSDTESAWAVDRWGEVTATSVGLIGP